MIQIKDAVKTALEAEGINLKDVDELLVSNPKINGFEDSPYEL